MSFSTATLQLYRKQVLAFLEQKYPSLHKHTTQAISYIEAQSLITRLRERQERQQVKEALRRPLQQEIERLHDEIVSKDKEILQLRLKHLQEEPQRHHRSPTSNHHQQLKKPQQQSKELAEEAYKNDLEKLQQERRELERDMEVTQKEYDSSDEIKNAVKSLDTLESKSDLYKLVLSSLYYGRITALAILSFFTLLYKLFFNRWNATRKDLKRLEEDVTKCVGDSEARLKSEVEKLQEVNKTSAAQAEAEEKEKEAQRKIAKKNEEEKFIKNIANAVEEKLIKKKKKQEEEEEEENKQRHQVNLFGHHISFERIVIAQSVVLIVQFLLLLKQVFFPSFLKSYSLKQG